MGGFREEKREARELLHEYMSVPALCFMDPASAPTPVTVRVHEKWSPIGDLKGTNFNYAEVEDVTPRIVFWASEITPKGKMFVSIERGVAYQIDVVLPRDGQTITAIANRMSPDKTNQFPVPEVQA